MPHPVFFIAYKAQLQQYQQQKQKILGAGQTISNEQMSDNEEENDELEHNFSVFECPGILLNLKKEKSLKIF